MEADFAGWATKAGLRCSDGRTILPDAFKHQDTLEVPLVWQHGHSDVENVLGKAILENRDTGVYCYCFFNKKLPKAVHAAALVENRDIKHLSIWANQLIERGGKVLHGVIREVSLVLSGANPGALIESVTIRHDGGETELEDEAIIHTGLEFEEIHHMDDDNQDDVRHAVGDDEDENEDDEDETVEDVWNTLSEKQKQVVHFMLGEAIASAEESMKQDSVDSDKEGETAMGNIFEQKDRDAKSNGGSKGSVDRVLSHSDIMTIVETARKNGSLKDAVSDYALSHGIDDIDTLFPDAKALDSVPEWNKRRTEWVTTVLSGTRKSPFSRVKSLWADITEEEARAKGYIKGNLKKEEFFNVAKRTTTPTTVYKKQKLDRDDILDITDFDVVAWLKGEMRLMLDEEIARAVLIGDGRDISSDDKINEQNIRPIAKDHDLYVTTVWVNIDDSNSSVQELIDGIVLNRQYYKGTGMPTMFTTETYLAKFLLLRDTVNRTIYRSMDELATQLRVANIVPVEVLEDEPEIVAILVNLQDYVLGADKGGNVSLFDDFDIDYNQQKYLIETRLSGALVKLKSAIVIRKTDAASVSVTPTAPTYDAEAGEVTIVNTTGVVYKNAETDATVNAAGSPYTVAEGDTMEVVATAASGYHFPTTAGTRWTFRNRA